MDPKLKKRIYLGLWLVLGALVGTVVGELAELFIVTTHDEVIENMFVTYAILVTVGIIVGMILGPIAWRKIYVEGLRGKKYVVKAKK